MKTKQINKPKEFPSYEEKSLTQVWKGEVVISLTQAKILLRAFKQEGIKRGSECLIFKDATSTSYRRVGQQDSQQMVDVFEELGEEDGKKN